MIYMGTDAFSRAISFLLLPLISKYLIPAELGIAANFDVLQSILALLTGQAVVNALPYFFYKKTKEDLALLVSNLIWIIVFFNIVFSLFIFIGSGIINSYLKLGGLLQILTVVVVISMLLSEIDKLIFRLEDKPGQFAILQLAQSFIYIILQVIMVIGLRMQAVGRIYSSVISVSLLCCVHLYILYRKKYIVFNIDWTEIKSLLQFGVPLLPHSLSFWLKSGLDKVLLTTYCGLAVNGLYSMAMTFGAIYAMCQQSFSRAYVPYLQKRLNSITESNEESEKIKIVKQTYAFGLLFILLFALLIPFCWVVVHYVINDKYLGCFTFIPFILLARTIHSFYSFTVEYVYTAKKTVGLGIITFSGSLIQLVATFILIRFVGVDGIKISIVLGEILILIAVWWYSNRVYPMPWFNVAKLIKGA